MARVGELFISLRASTAAFSRDMRNATQISARSAREIERSLKTIGLAAGAAGAAMAGALALMVRRGINTADQFQKLSQRTGVAVETLSAFAHGAQLAGVDTDQLAQGLGLLNRRMLEATQAASSEAARAFERLGVRVTGARGELRDTEEVLLELADRFQRLGPGAEATALAMQIFGRSGAQLLPFLLAGRDGLEQYRAEAERLGLIIDGRTARAAERFNDNLKRLESRVTGLGTAVGNELLPGLVAITDRFDESAGGAERLKAAAESIAGGVRTAAELFTGLALVIGFFIEAARTARREVGVLTEGLSLSLEAVHLAINNRDFTGAFETARKGVRTVLGGMERETLDFWKRLGAASREADRLMGELFPPHGMARVEGAPASFFRQTAVTGQAEEAAKAAKAFNEWSRAIRGAVGPLQLGFQQLEPFRMRLRDLARAAEEDGVRAFEALSDSLPSIPADVLASLGRAEDVLRGFGVDATKALAQMARPASELANRMEEMGRRASSAFEQILIHGRGLSNLLDVLIAQAVRLFAELAFGDFFRGAKNPFVKFFGGLLGFQQGGFPPVGRVSLVGERGPELIVPRAPVEVIPNHRLARLGGDATGSDLTVHIKVEPSPLLEVEIARGDQDAAAAGARLGAAAGVRTVFEILKRNP